MCEYETLLSIFLNEYSRNNWHYCVVEDRQVYSGNTIIHCTLLLHYLNTLLSLTWAHNISYDTPTRLWPKQYWIFFWVFINSVVYNFYRESLRQGNIFGPPWPYKTGYSVLVWFCFYSVWLWSSHRSRRYYDPRTMPFKCLPK